MFPWTKPYDLEALYEAWKDAPVFDGKSPKPEKGRFDINTWLDKIEEGCSSRKVPKDSWHKVAQHYLGKNACSRFLEVEKVLTNLHGGRFTWTWKTFRKTLASIRWDIDTFKMLSFQRVASTFRRIVRKTDDTTTKPNAAFSPNAMTKPNAPSTSIKVTTKSNASSTSTSPQPVLKRTSTLKGLISRSDTPSNSADKASEKVATPSRMFSISKESKPVPASVQSEKKRPPQEKESSKKLKKDDASVKAKGSMKGQVYVPKPTDSAAELIVNAPLWLMETCISLEELTCEYPKTMSVLAAVLLTVGAIPTLPAVSAGAAGAFLASTTAHTIGSVAIGLGTLIAAQGQLQGEKAKG
ncbi:hypothetical protein EIP86_006903 [Pleurotus ostreatoroseus]|nr:hypothetical protein EIP86_006903 [Pleurotus ostreatoroseus]